MNPSLVRRLSSELSRLDLATYEAIARTGTPTLDRVFRDVSRAADYSKLWLGSAALLVAAGGPRGPRAAAEGLASVALTAAVVNILLKPVGRRARPNRATHEVAGIRHVRMPRSRSFPSGHAASAFAFATGVGSSLPEAAVPLSALATLVAYSRVHTGVHYPLDSIFGSVAGLALAPLAITLLRHLQGRAEAAAGHPGEP